MFHQGRQQSSGRRDRVHNGLGVGKSDFQSTLELGFIEEGNLIGGVERLSWA
jgi:hypothetical protein